MESNKTKELLLKGFCPKCGKELEIDNYENVYCRCGYTIDDKTKKELTKNNDSNKNNK